MTSKGREVRYFNHDFDWTEWVQEISKRETLPPITDATHATGRPPQDSTTNPGDDMAKADAEHWDDFFQSHSTGAMYKPRRYLIPEFIGYLPIWKDTLTIVEVGCGYGCTMQPLIQHYLSQSSGNITSSSLRYYATDYAIRALEILQAHQIYAQYQEYVTTMVWDVTLPPPMPLASVSADVIFAIFALSAVEPQHHLACMQHMRTLLQNEPPSSSTQSSPSSLPSVMPEEEKRNKKIICFRDYGLHDLTMYRHQHRRSEFLFERHDGTKCFYFSKEYMYQLAETSGFRVLECEYATVININRKTKQELHRVFLHSVLELVE